MLSTRFSWFASRFSWFASSAAFASLVLLILVCRPAVAQSIVDLAASPPHFTVHGAAAGDQLSETRAVEVGDLNGDGFPDLVVGEPRFGGAAGAAAGRGRVHVLFGPLPAGGMLDLAIESADVTILGRDAMALGWSIEIGDVRGDGQADLVIGAPFGGDPGELQGEVVVLFGPLGGRTLIDLSIEAADLRVVGELAESRFGTALDVVPAGIVAPPRLIVGAPEEELEDASGNIENAGVVHLIDVPVVNSPLRRLGVRPAEERMTRRRGSGGALPPALSADGEFGASLAFAEYRIPGVPESGIGTPGEHAHLPARAVGPDMGAVLHGQGGAGSSSYYFGVCCSGARLGSDMSAGDVGSDGFPDFVAGAPGGDELIGQVPAENAGQLLVTALDPVFNVLSRVSLYGRTAGDALGWSVGAADLTGDGDADVLAGAPGNNGLSGTREDAGLLLVYAERVLLEPTLIDLAAPFDGVLVYGARAGDRLGTALATGELSGDGYGDVAIGAAGSSGPSGGRPQAGAVIVLRGPLESTPTVDCVAGGPRTLDCGELERVPGGYEVTLDATGSLGAIDDYEWILDCGSLTVLADGSNPTVVLPLTPCGAPCSVRLTVRGSGAEDSCTSTISLVDSSPPTLSAVPADETVECDAVPPAAPVTAQDDCSPTPVLDFAETRVDGPCAGTYELTRTWTATDDCSNTVSAVQRLSVFDATPPTLEGVPLAASVSCDAVPPVASVTARDACSSTPALDFGESRVDGPCPDSYELIRTWTATDDCGNVASAVQVVSVSDLEPPLLLGVPADVVVDCKRIPAPAAVSAIDDCDDAPTQEFTEQRVDGPCPGTYELIRAWSAIDRCGNFVEQSQLVSVVDTEPPAVVPGTADLMTLRPPNHRMVCLDRSAFAPSITDDCSEPVTWRLVGCASDQDDDGIGDGHTSDDCVVEAGGESLCIRAERDGTGRAGRRYAVGIVATDACGNESAPVTIGFIHVSHDQREGR